MSGEEKGVGQCAFDPRHNSTYVFSGESQALHYQSSHLFVSQFNSTSSFNLKGQR